MVGKVAMVECWKGSMVQGSPSLLGTWGMRETPIVKEGTLKFPITVLLLSRVLVVRLMLAALYQVGVRS